jgi:hypothetical protein
MTEITASLETALRFKPSFYFWVTLAMCNVKRSQNTCK